MLSFTVFFGFSSHTAAQINHTVHILQPGHLPPPSICMVTVDPELEKNRIVWKKSNGIGIISYNVYREVHSPNNYVFMGNVPFLQEPAFTDANSFPQRQQYRYKISVIDTCGNESELSSSIKPFFLDGFACTEGNCLTWEPSMENDMEYVFDSVIIFRGDDPAMLLPVDTTHSFVLSYTDLKVNLPDKERIFYRIAGIKEMACYTDRHSNNNSGIPNDLALSNMVSILRDPNSTETVNYQGKIIISPNPFDSETLIKWKNTSGSISNIFLYDLHGMLIKEINNLRESEYKLQRENLSGGCYIIEVRGRERFFGRLFVI